MKKLTELEEAIGLKFKDPHILEVAFTHKSYVNETPDVHEHNERLEFLGDAVLELAVTDYLYRNYPDKPEGELTNWRSALVKGKNLAQVASALHLGDYLMLSNGEEMSGGRTKSYILANTMESLIGAIYMDKDYNTANEFILKFIIVLLEEIIKKGLYIDSKSRVQELAQEKLNITPRYELLKESGPDHDKIFEMGIYFVEELVGKGKGPSKQEAEQAAALKALKTKKWS